MLYAGIAMYFISKDIDKIKEEFGVAHLNV
jgi:hypothetical protein